MYFSKWVSPLVVPGPDVTCVLTHENKWASDDGGMGGEEEEEFETERIVSKKPHRGNQLYLVRWKGCGQEDDSWEPLAHLTGCRG